MLKKILIVIISILILGSIGALVYWYIYLRSTGPDTVVNTDGTTVGEGFSSFDRSTKTNNSNLNNSTSTDIKNTVEEEVVVESKIKIPALRQISTMPVSGLAASSTATTSIARYIDRGTGHIYEVNSSKMDIIKISNTTLPKTYESYFNKNLNAFVTRYLRDETDTITNFYAELRSTGTSTTVTPYETKGKYISQNINQIINSPNRDRIFTWSIESGNGVGYISSFDEKNKIKIAQTPIRQVVLDWPETNTVSITTKSSALLSGYFYLIDTKNGVMKKVLGGIKGLVAKANRDLSKIIYSSTDKGNIITKIYNTKDNTDQEIVFRTIADKCVWSTKRKNEVYCAVPNEINTNYTYPDDWYKGNVSFVDQIWHLDTATGEVHLLANLTSLSNKIIDATDLSLDTNEDYLYFINKRDLTAWSLDLNN